MDLKDKAVTITGAGSGIGKATAKILARRDANLVLIDRSAKGLKETLKDISNTQGKHSKYICDVSKPEQVRTAFKNINKRHNPVDVHINNAGILEYGRIYELSPKKWLEVIKTNLFGQFLCCRYVLPNMIKRKRGHIINIASIYGKTGSPMSSAYCASKFGVRGMSQSMFEEVRKYNIKVTVVNPDTTNTNLFKGTKFRPNPKKILDPEDIAKAISGVLDIDSHSMISEVDAISMLPAYKNGKN